MRERVLIFAHNFPPAPEGGARLLGLIALAEKQRGNQVLVITSDARLTDEYLKPEAQRLKRVGRFYQIPIIRLWTWRWGKRVIRRLFGPIFISLPLPTLFRFRPTRIIAGVFPSLVPLYGWVLAKIFAACFILVPCFHQKEKGFFRPWLLWVLARADQIWALTQNEAKFYQKRFGIAKNKIVVFRPRLPKEYFLPSDVKVGFPKPPTILFIGASSKHKRIELLLAAVKKFWREGKGVQLFLVGPKTLYWPKVASANERLPRRVKKAIRVFGEVSERKKRRLLDQSWVLVNPSIQESLGLVFFEAWARKKPVVAAKIPVLEEVIEDGKDGLLFEPDNLGDLVAKVGQIIEDEKLARKMGEKGYQKLRIYEYTKIEYKGKIKNHQLPMTKYQIITNDQIPNKFKNIRI